MSDASPQPAAGNFWIEERERIRLLLVLSFLLNASLLVVHGGDADLALMAIRGGVAAFFIGAILATFGTLVAARRAIVCAFLARHALLAATYWYTHDIQTAWILSAGALVLIAFLVEITLATQIRLTIAVAGIMALAIGLDSGGTTTAPPPWRELAIGAVLCNLSIVVRAIALRMQTQAMAQFQINTRFLQTALDAMPSAVAIFDRDFHLLVGNQAWRGLHDGSARAPGTNYLATLRAVGDEPSNRIADHLRALTESSDRRVAPLTYARQIEGETRWFAVDGAPFVHEGARHIVVVHDDISAIKLAEERARRAEVRFDRAVRGSQHGIWEVDLKRNSLYCSDVLLEAFGFTRDDMSDNFHDWLAYIHPEDLPKLQKQAAQHLRGETERLDFTYRVRRKDGSFGWARVTGHCWRDDAGTPAILAGSLVDVTDQHRATEALARSEDQLRTMVDTALHAILSIDAAGTICEFNPAAAEALGYTRDEVIGRPIDDFLPEAARSPVREFVQGMLHPPKTTRVVGEATVYRKDGTQAQMEIASFVGSTQSGPRLYAFMYDVSEQRRLERLKDEMIATLSHELRTPLTSLRGFSELLIAKDFPEVRRRRYLAIIHEEAERMAHLVNDFLNVRRAEIGSRSYDLVPTPFAAVVADGLRRVPAQAKARHTIEVDVPAELPAVAADQEALARVVENLVSNACKFSPEGGPVVVAARQHGAYVVCRVQDEGIGIPADELPRLFEKFYRGDAARKLAIGGTGLGLSICKAILHAHHGRIWFESTVGSGTTAWFEVPTVSQAEYGMPVAAATVH